MALLAPCHCSSSSLNACGLRTVGGTITQQSGTLEYLMVRRLFCLAFGISAHPMWSSVRNRPVSPGSLNQFTEPCNLKISIGTVEPFEYSDGKLLGVLFASGRVTLLFMIDSVAVSGKPEVKPASSSRTS